MAKETEAALRERKLYTNFYQGMSAAYSYLNSAHNRIFILGNRHLASYSYQELKKLQVSDSKSIKKCLNKLEKTLELELTE